MDLPKFKRSIYTKAEFIDVIDKAGLSETLGVMLSQAPLLIREQWYANPMIDITDSRVISFFQTANVDLNTIFK